MAFLDDLRSSNQTLNQSGGGSYFGQPGQDQSSPAEAASSMMPFFHDIRNRNLQDFKDKAQFTSDLGIREARIKSLFQPQGGQNSDMSQGVVYKEPEKNPATTPITPFQQAGLNIDRSKLALDQQKSQSAQALDERQFGLATQKNENIRDQKEADLTQRAKEAATKLELAQQKALTDQSNNAAQLALHQAQVAALAAQHDLENHQNQAKIDETARINNARIQEMKDRIDALQRTSTTQSQTMDSSGNPSSIVTDTTRGSKSDGKTTPNKNDPAGIRHLIGK